MRTSTFSLLLATLLASAPAMAENFRPLSVSPADCQITLQNSDTGETFQPKLSLLQRRFGIDYLGTHYLQAWQNSYPDKQRQLSIMPYLGDQGTVVIRVNASWEDSAYSSQKIQRHLQLQYTQTAESEFLLKTRELYQRMDARTLENVDDQRNLAKRSSETRLDVKNRGRYVISYTSANGLVLSGSCKLSPVTEGDESHPL